ncbi:MAG: hypothetical protein ACPG47_02275 [Leucothrix sp.]
MRNGFPDYHQFPERDHGDESFWPSFTDIMMVITMVFLLVTVMAITNNWKLVTDLKASVLAERLAAEQALDKEAKNNTLEDQMVLLQRRLVDANKVAVDKQVANSALQEELNRILTRVSSIEKELETSLKAVQAREQQLAISSQQIEALTADRDKQLATLATRAQALTNLQGIQETSQQQVLRLQEALDLKQAALLASQQDQQSVQSQLTEAQEMALRQQAALKAELLALSQQQTVLEAAKTDGTSKIAALEAALRRANAALLASQEDSSTQLTDLQARLQQTEATLVSSQESQQLTEQQLDTMRAEAIALEQAKRDSAASLIAMREEVAQLKNEFDSLDSKYQKLVRPARSSEGKHVVSVWFSKQSGRGVYRIRNGSQGSFSSTTRKEMANTLAALKNKYGKKLYVKVIIPENSGLSYSDAWRFTTEMQREYDYYYQDDE